MDIADVLGQLGQLWDIYSRPTTIVVSGGEPMMQQEGLVPVVEFLTEYYNKVHIETAGTIAPGYKLASLVEQFNVSPKLEHSGNPLGKRIKPKVLQEFVATHKAWFKFVVRSRVDLEEIDDIVRDNNIPYDRVMIMPEGTTVEANMAIMHPKMAEMITSRGWGISFRTHVLIWPNDKDK
jgi:organic radical activating enzyme